MANQEHVNILRQGIAVWNVWRQEHLKIRPDLRGACFSGAHLSGVDLRGCDLRNIDLGDACLIYAELSHADLNNADLHRANLSHAKLNSANLLNADLTATDFRNANLSHANLRFAQFRYTWLNDASLHAAHLDSTTFAGVNLHAVEGLDTVIHDGPSIVDVKTVKLPEGQTCIRFLRGTGFSDTFIGYLPSLLTTAIQYASCFISYAYQDEGLARRLYNDLQGNGVRCWYAPEHMKTGDRIRPRVHEQIWFNDKLLLVLSGSSVASEWVDYEVETALARERKEKRDILFPIQLDDAVKESTAAWAAHIQSARHITDFTRWKEHDEYQKGLTRLLRDLKQEAIPDTIESDADKD